MEQHKFQKYINLFTPVMEAMHSVLGDQSEFILHDLSQPQSSVVAIVGDVTHRQIGAPITNLVINALKEHGDNAADLIDYLSVAKDGRQLKSSTVFIRDEAGSIVGCLCYNIDLTQWRMAENLLKSICFVKGHENGGKHDNKEIFAQDIGDVVEDIIQYEIENFGKPVPHMSRADKLQLVTSLEGKGVFAVKGSAELVARYLGSSVFTVYNYLKEVRHC